MTGTPRVAPAVVHTSMRRIKTIALTEHATVVFHHDGDAWKNVRVAPQCYD